ncbi:TonB-dependent receptor [uncultured Microbulbifer sp.]|uniref:TonB-dependent receptor n=1 Tax=uncultured Microbulbifer sp. TaxID=348147 RepID=UPI00261C2603|nr:TonB-dependent receptor [uncultured Microbulbifer sp.]
MRSKIRPLVAVCLTGLILLMATATPQSRANTARAQQFDIPAGGLDQVLNRFALAAGVRLHLNAALSRDMRSQGLEGHYTVEQGFSRLLANTGLRAERQSDGAYRLAVAAGQGVMQIPVIEVAGSGERGSDGDRAGYDAVYDDDLSTAFNGREEIERYKGKDSADIFKGMLNIYSGDARNGGGLDPSIRGIQGPGRVPLSIDGTEQALTVWRGYRGISNRNYIDPNLIASVQVIKGPAIRADVHTSVGGGIAVNTLSASDVLESGDTFGGTFKVEASDNAVAPRTPTLLTGQDYRDVGGFPQDTPNFPYGDPSLWKKMDDSKNENLFSGEDYAYRLALATRGAGYELLGAYAYRNKGNYYSGSRRADFYSEPDGPEFSETRINPRTLAHRQRPGHEVPNTSSEMASVLLKGKAQFTGGQSLELGIRHTDARYGEIMSSRAGSLVDNTMAQWPLSQVDARAYHLNYQWQPGSKWINVQSRLWATDTVSDTNSAGGFPNFANPVESPLPDASPILRNTAASNAAEHRVGVDINNAMTLTDSLAFNLSGTYQYQKLRSDDQYNGIVDGWRQWPRAGRREEINFSLKLDWLATEYLRLNAAMRYVNYWAFDDFLDSRIKAGDERISTMSRANKGKYLNYDTLEQYTEEEIQENIAIVEERIANDPLWVIIFPDLKPLTEEQKKAMREQARETTYAEKRRTIWLHDGQGKYSRAGNPCTNGQLAATLIAGTCRIGNQFESYDVPIVAEKHRGRGWVPALVATVFISDNSRVYVRYTEALRYPSLFESTLGFSSTFNPYTDLKPEHAYNYELAYIHNFENSDLKLSYYHHRTEDIIERAGISALQFYNIEQQTLRGLEFSGRYDGGRFFTDLSLAYNLENTVCDESLAIQQDPNGALEDCQYGGFSGGYLVDQVVPKLSANWNLGGRFFNNRLETGVRMVYLSGSEREETLERASATTFDAYLSYRAKGNLNFELVGTNLTDIYYTDPLVRSSVPAPGRILKLVMGVNF